MGFDRRLRAIVVSTALTCVALSVAAASASASFHEIKISEVSKGSGGGAQDSFLEVQMYAPGQTLLSGASLFRCNDAACGGSTSFGMFPNGGFGDNQRTYVFGDTAMGAGLKDFTVDLNLDATAAGGAICYVGGTGFNDCVSWGAFTGNAVLEGALGTGATPGTPMGPLTDGTGLARKISAGCPTLLEASDDTNDSLADFAPIMPPGARKNSVTPTEVPCAVAAPPATVSTTAPATVRKGCPKGKKLKKVKGKKRCVKKKKKK
jgi:hypothetical protein